MRYTVTKDWTVRLQLSVFTVPEGSTVEVGELDMTTAKVIVKFSERDIDWFSLSEVSAHTDFVLDK
jgi:hypothetical protein